MQKNKPLFFPLIEGGNISIPAFFPDATRAFIKTLDSSDIENTKTKGILVNTYHLFFQVGKKIFKHFGGVKNFMNFHGAVISDSGGFQIMSLIKNRIQKGTITDEGIVLQISSKKKTIFTPEISIRFQMLLQPDAVVVLDDYTDLKADRAKARESVERTILWAIRSKKEYEKIIIQNKIKKPPKLFAVVQGGEYLDLRRECGERLSEIGFDGYGHGGWPINREGQFDYSIVDAIVESVNPNSFLFGFGIGKPEEIVECVKRGFCMFDCVLPTRDARHRRLYVYNAKSIDSISLFEEPFYSFYIPDKKDYYADSAPVSMACDCLLCRNYSRAYLYHLFKSEEFTAGRLATIHNLRFYSILMEKISEAVI